MQTPSNFVFGGGVLEEGPQVESEFCNCEHHNGSAFCGVPKDSFCLECPHCKERIKNGMFDLHIKRAHPTVSRPELH